MYRYDKCKEMIVVLNVTRDRWYRLYRMGTWQYISKWANNIALIKIGHRDLILTWNRSKV